MVRSRPPYRIRQDSPGHLVVGCLPLCVCRLLLLFPSCSDVCRSSLNVSGLFSSRGRERDCPATRPWQTPPPDQRRHTYEATHRRGDRTGHRQTRTRGGRRRASAVCRSLARGGRKFRPCSCWRPPVALESRPPEDAEPRATGVDRRARWRLEWWLAALVWCRVRVGALRRSEKTLIRRSRCGDSARDDGGGPRGRRRRKPAPTTKTTDRHRRRRMGRRGGRRTRHALPTRTRGVTPTDGRRLNRGATASDLRFPSSLRLPCRRLATTRHDDCPQ